MNSPKNITELLERAKSLCGKRIKDVAREISVDLPKIPKHAKGFVGELAERYLGASSGNLDQPDFPDLSIELKTIPMNEKGRVCESTFICTIDLHAASQANWESSRAWRKLRQVLWLPVEAAQIRPFAERRFGKAILWQPTTEERNILKADWHLLMGKLASGVLEDVDAKLGQALQIRPKAANSAVRTEIISSDGELISVLPRGFYLRAKFTEKLLWALTDGD